MYELVPEQKGGWPRETSVLPPSDPSQRTSPSLPSARIASHDHLPHLGNCPTLRISRLGSFGACSLSLAGTVSCPPQLALFLNECAPKRQDIRLIGRHLDPPGGPYVTESISRKGIVGLSSLLSDLQSEQLAPPQALLRGPEQHTQPWTGTISQSKPLFFIN